MSWDQVAIGEVADIVSGATPKSSVADYWGGDVAWATPTDLSKLKGKHLAHTERMITRKGLSSCAARVLPANSVLFSSRAPIGLVAINTEPMATNQGFKSFVPSDELDASFLFWWLKANRQRLEDLGTGATFKEVSKRVVSEVQIPLPPIEEQRRIAAILDKADAIRRKREQALDLADEFLKSAFLEIFGDPETNPKGWPLGTIRDLVTEAKYGTSQKADPKNGHYPVLRMGNITYSGRLDLTDLKYIDLAEKDVPKHTVRKGDLLFNRTNSPDLVGKTTVFDVDEPFAFAGYLVRARTNERADPYYISFFLNSDFGKQTLRSMCKRIIGMANINAQEFQNIPIPIADRETQAQFRSIVDAFGTKRALLQDAVLESIALFGSLSQRAFRGEL